jgi:hypothetical protein
MAEETKPSALPPLTPGELELVKDVKVQSVEVPEWGRTIHLRCPGADEAMKLEEEVEAIPADKAPEKLYLLLAECLSDANGDRLFAERAKARDWLGKRNGWVLLRLQAKALEVLGWEVKAQEAAKKDSGGTEPAASPSA